MAEHRNCGTPWSYWLLIARGDVPLSGRSAYCAMADQLEPIGEPRFPAAQSETPGFSMSGCAHFELADIVPDAAVARAAPYRCRLFLRFMVSGNTYRADWLLRDQST